MAWRRADIGAVQAGSGWRRADIGAVQAVAAAVGDNAGIMTTNTGFWGPTFVMLLGLLALFC